MRPATRPLPYRIILMLLLAAAPLTGQADGAVFIKGGIARLSDTTQVIDGRARTLEEDEGIYGISVEHRTRRGISFGFEFLREQHDFTTPGLNQPGNAETTMLQFQAKNYFRSDKDIVRPFIGIGIGGSYSQIDYTDNLSSSYDDEAFGLVLQALGGVEWRLKNISVLAEVKYLWHDTDSGDYDPSALGVLVGFGFNW